MIYRQIFPLAVCAVAVCLFACGDGNRATLAAASTRVHITVNDDGYEPYEVHAFKGKPLTMVFTRTTELACGEEVQIPDYHIRAKLPVNKPVEITFTPVKSGRLAFMCGMAKMKGAIIVQ